jgi:flagellin
MSISIDSIKLFDSNGNIGILDTESTTTNGAVTYSVSTLNISTYTATTADLDDLDEMIGTVDDALQSMISRASDIGAIKKRIDMQTNFVNDLTDAIERGVGSLVDADMNQESTRLQALQVQQQLGIQALTIANSSAQTVMALFK